MEYDEICEVIDQLCHEGYFGEKVKEMTILRDELSSFELIEKYLLDWIDDDKAYGKENVRYFTLQYLLIYTEALKVNPQKVEEILLYFFKGFPENPETEIYSSFNDFSISLQKSKNDIKPNPQNSNLSDRYLYARSLINTYSKGVEIFGKLLTLLILLLKLSKNQEYNPYSTHILPLGQKVKEFTSLSDGNFDNLTRSIDRNIRNSDAHVDIIYIPRKNKFQYKIRKGNKIQKDEISGEKFLLDRFPSVVNVVKAFFNSTSLLVYSGYDQKKFMELYSKYFQVKQT